jgi:hypothetical protein
MIDRSLERSLDKIRAMHAVNEAILHLTAFRFEHGPRLAWITPDVRVQIGWVFDGCGCNPGKAPIAAAWKDDETLLVLYPYGNIERGSPWDVPICFWALSRTRFCYSPRIWHAWAPTQFANQESPSRSECICVRCGEEGRQGWPGFHRALPEGATPCTEGVPSTAREWTEPLRAASAAKAKWV